MFSFKLETQQVKAIINAYFSFMRNFKINFKKRDGTVNPLKLFSVILNMNLFKNLHKEIIKLMRFSINFNFSNYNSMKNLFYSNFNSILFSSCISQRKYTALETKQKETKDLLNTATVKLNSLIDEKAKVDATVEALKDQLSFLKANNTELINNMGNLTTLSQQEPENLERSLESLKEKDLRITKMQDAVTKKRFCYTSTSYQFERGTC